MDSSRGLNFRKLMNFFFKQLWHISYIIRFSLATITDITSMSAQGYCRWMVEKMLCIDILLVRWKKLIDSKPKNNVTNIDMAHLQSTIINLSIFNDISRSYLMSRVINCLDLSGTNCTSRLFSLPWSRILYSSIVRI